MLSGRHRRAYFVHESSEELVVFVERHFDQRPVVVRQQTLAFWPQSALPNLNGRIKTHWRLDDQITITTSVLLCRDVLFPAAFSEIRIHWFVSKRCCRWLCCRSRCTLPASNVPRRVHQSIWTASGETRGLPSYVIRTVSVGPLISASRETCMTCTWKRAAIPFLKFSSASDSAAGA